jgi:hypothetical protein
MQTQLQSQRGSQTSDNGHEGGRPARPRWANFCRTHLQQNREYSTTQFCH